MKCVSFEILKQISGFDTIKEAWSSLRSSFHQDLKEELYKSNKNFLRWEKKTKISLIPFSKFKEFLGQL